MRVPISLRAVATATVLALTLAACGGDDDTTDEATPQSAAPQLEDGVLTVCTDSPYPPFEFEEEGEFRGFDVDLVRAIVQQYDATAEFQVTGFEAIQSGAALNAGQCELAASAMTITEEREENLNFSDPYFDATQSLLVRVEDEDRYPTLEDLAGQRIGVQADTTGAQYATENAPEGAEIVDYPDAPTAITALRAGEVEAVLQDFPVNAEYAQEEDAFTIVEQYDTGEQYGFAVAEEGADELLEAINDGLAEIQANGEYDRIFEEYFGESPDDDADTGTTTDTATETETVTATETATEEATETVTETPEPAATDTGS